MQLNIWSKEMSEFSVFGVIEQVQHRTKKFTGKIMLKHVSAKLQKIVVVIADIQKIWSA